MMADPVPQPMTRWMSLFFGTLIFFLWGPPVLPVSSASGPSEIPEGLFVTQLALDPRNPQTLYALTTYSIGVLKSTDGGMSWVQINDEIRSFSLYQLTVHPTLPDTLYLGAGGAGLFKSSDGGKTWRPKNSGLQNTDIGMLVLHPEDPNQIYIVTSTGLYKSPDAGESWEALNQGDDFTSSQQFQDLIVLPTKPASFLLASGKGLFTRREGDAGWVPASDFLLGKQVSALARQEKTGRLYAGVLRRGTLKTLGEGGLFRSSDGGASWTRLGEGLEGTWIRVIRFDPDQPDTIYLGTSGRGVLKSADGGRTWAESNAGLTDPDRDIRSLVIDPTNHQRFYAGSHGHWVYRSMDRGASWTALPLGRHDTASDILASLIREDQGFLENPTVFPPPAFQKCNRCHGWTDPRLNRVRGTWRVAVNHRDWLPTVRRMSRAASLTPEEETEVAEFLNRYTGGK